MGKSLGLPAYKLLGGSHGQKIRIDQRTKAESDIAVAAASILAREAFIDWLDERSKALGLRLDRGVSPGVKEAARKLVGL